MGRLPETTAVHHTGKKGPITLTTCGLWTGDCGDGLVLIVSVVMSILAKAFSLMLRLFSWQMEGWYYTCFQYTCPGCSVETVVINHKAFR